MAIRLLRSRPRGDLGAVSGEGEYRPTAVEENAGADHDRAGQRADGGALPQIGECCECGRMNGELAVIGDRLDHENPTVRAAQAPLKPGVGVLARAASRVSGTVMASSIGMALAITALAWRHEASSGTVARHLSGAGKSVLPSRGNSDHPDKTNATPWTRSDALS